MTKKKKIFGILGTVSQLLSVAAGFFPFIYRIEEYIFDPLTREFIFEKTVRKYNLFFDPTKLDITEAAADIPGKGISFGFSLLFVLFGVAAAVFGLLSVVKNKKTKLPVIACVFGLVSLLLSAFGALTFNYQLMTWLYSGFASAGILIVLCMQLLALVFFAIAEKKK